MAIQTITYANKSYINQNSGIADTNKINDTDMNEIKSVVNNNANVLSGQIGQILWTNPNPTATFNAQNITLSSSDYDMLRIFYKKTSTESRMSSVEIIKGIGTDLGYVANGVVFSRAMSYNNDTSYTLNTGIYYLPDNSTQNVDNTRCVPIYVVGYKTGLF